MRLLFLSAELWPTHRADVAALFGKYLPRHSINSDLVTGRTSISDGSRGWGGGAAMLCDASGGQARKHITIFLHGILRLFMADRNRYDAIQVRDMPVLGMFGFFAARMKGLSFYYWMSYPVSEGQITYARERGLSQGLMKFLFPWLRGRVGCLLLYHVVLPMADHVFVQSERMKQDMIERGIESGKMTPVPMGVDFEFMRPEDVEPIDDPRLVGRRVLIYLGTMISTRRIEILFEMLARVRKKVPSALLVLVGDTEDEHQRQLLMQQAEKFGVAEHVVWTGWLPMRDGWRYVRAAELGLSPFPRGFLLDSASPTKVPEYLALGVPVVCNDNPDQQSIITGTGFGCCVTYSGESFALAVLDILSLDKTSLIKAKTDALLYIHEHRSYEHIARKVANTYREISKL